MAPGVEGGLLDGGASPENQELPSWRSTPWEESDVMTAPAKRKQRWLGCLRFPRRGGGSNGGTGAAGSEPKPLRPTAYLDGLRGFAAFLVYIHHNELWAHGASAIGENEMFENAYGYKGNYRFACLPFIRNFFTGGHMAVATFYVISGYVLAAKPLSLIQSGEHLKLLDNVASAIFRRWFRLYIPIMVTTFVYVTLWHIFGIWTANYEHKATVLEEWWNWYVEFKNFSFVFKEGVIWVTYNTHLWSIPLEMRGSIIVFCTVLSLARATARARHLCLIGLIIYFLYVADGYYGALFVMGILQCDLDLMAQRGDPEFPNILRRLEPYKKTLCYVFFVISMYLAGVPSETNKLENLRANPGWYWLSFLKAQAVFDPKWFYLFYAASFLVAVVPRIGWLKRFFESPFCQYLGRQSYALYLVHGPVLALLGDRLYAMVGWVRPVEYHQKMLAPFVNFFPISRAGPMGLELSFLVPHILLLPVTFYVSEIVTKYVDEPAVRWAAVFYKKTLASGPPAPKPEDAMRLA